MSTSDITEYNISQKDTILIIGNSLTNANVYHAGLSGDRLNFICTKDTKTY